MHAQSNIMLSTYKDSQAHGSRLQHHEAMKFDNQLQSSMKKKKLSVDTKSKQLDIVPSTSTIAEQQTPHDNIASKTQIGQALKLNFQLPGGPDLSKAMIQDGDHSLYLGNKSSTHTPNSLSIAQRQKQFLDQDGVDPVKEFEADLQREKEKYQQQVQLRSDVIAKRKASNNTSKI